MVNNLVNMKDIADVQYTKELKQFHKVSTNQTIVIFMCHLPWGVASILIVEDDCNNSIPNIFAPGCRLEKGIRMLCLIISRRIIRILKDPQTTLLFIK